MKKILVFVLLVALITPVHAGNGYSSGTFTHSEDPDTTTYQGMTYPFIHSFYYAGDGLGVSFYTPARVTRQHSSVQGVFSTKSHGLDTNYSGAVTYDPLSGTTYANPVYSQYDEPTGIISGHASITILSNPVFESDIRINFQ